MKKILLLLTVLLSTMTYAQGHETFDNLNTEGNSYLNGTFVGQDGITWVYGQSRGDIELNGKAITIGRNRAEPMFLESEALTNGVGTLEFSYVQAFSNPVNLEVLVNDVLVYTATSDGELGVVKSSGLITVDAAGGAVIKFSNEAGAQVTLDDIIWTAFDDTAGIDDNFAAGFSYFPNPMTNVLNINANMSIEGVEAFNLLGQQVISNRSLKNGQINVSSLPVGVYIFRVQFENGTKKSFKVVKQ